MMDKFNFNRVSRFQSFIALTKGAFNMNGIGYILERYECGAIGQRHCRQINHHAITPFKARPGRFTEVYGCDRATQGAPNMAIVMERMTPRRYRIDVRMLIEDF